MPFVMNRSRPQRLSSDDRAFKAAVHQRLVAFRKVNGLGCLMWLAKNGFPRGTHINAADTMLRDAYEGKAVSMAAWIKIAKALDRVEGKTDPMVGAASGERKP